MHMHMYITCVWIARSLSLHLLIWSLSPSTPLTGGGPTLVCTSHQPQRPLARTVLPLYARLPEGTPGPDDP